MLRRVDNNGKGIKCAICNVNNTFMRQEENYKHNKVCISCYFKNDHKIPKHVPFEQHDLWIIKNHERNSK